MVYTVPSATRTALENETRFQVGGLGGLRADCQRSMCDGLARYLRRRSRFVNAVQPQVRIIPGVGPESDELVVIHDPCIDASVIGTRVTRLLRTRGLTARRSDVN